MLFVASHFVVVVVVEGRREALWMMKLLPGMCIWWYQAANSNGSLGVLTPGINLWVSVSRHMSYLGCLLNQAGWEMFLSVGF